MKSFDQSPECYRILKNCFKIVKNRNLTIQNIIDGSGANTQASSISKFCNEEDRYINPKVAESLWNYFWSKRPNVMYLAESIGNTLENDGNPNSMEFLAVLLNSEFGNISKELIDYYEYIFGFFALYYKLELETEDDRVVCSKIEFKKTTTNSVKITESVYSFDRYNNRKPLTEYIGYLAKLGDMTIAILKNEDKLSKIMFIYKLNFTGVMKEIDEIRGFIISESSSSYGNFHSFFIAERINIVNDGYFGLFSKSGIKSTEAKKLLFT